MTFLQPGWLALLPLAVGLLLLMRSRRSQDLVVPSLVVWRTLEAGAGRGAWRPRVRWRDPLLWLQTLAVVVLVLAAARPVLNAGDGPRHTIVLVDTTLAMQALDVEPSRFEAAVATLRDAWARERAGEVVSLVAVGTWARVEAARWQPGSELARRLERLRVSDGSPDWAGAALRASVLARPSDETRVTVLTAPSNAAAARAALEGSGFAASQVSVAAFGGEPLNLGIGESVATPRSARAGQWLVEGRVVSSGFERGDTVRLVAAFRPEGTETFLPWGGADVTLGANGSGAFSFPLDLPGPGELELRTPGGDQLPGDDRWVLALRDAPVRVGVVGSVHPGLARALGAMDGVEAYSVPAGWSDADLGAFDLVVVAPDAVAAPPTSTLWFGAPLPGVEAGPVPRTELADVRAAPHRLTVDLDASALALTAARALRLVDGAEPLLTAGDAVIAWARTTAAGRQVALGFALEESAWAAQLGFPAFVAALVDWAAPHRAGAQGAGCQVGAACAWPAAAYAGIEALVDPDGRTVTLGLAPRTSSGDPLATAVWEPGLFDLGFVPERAGVHRLTLATGSYSLPVARPVGVAPTGTVVEQGAANATEALASYPEPWWWLAAAAVVVLTLEAVVAARRREVVLRRSGSAWVLALALAAPLAALAGVGVPSLQHGGHAVLVARPGPAGGPALPDAPGWVWTNVERSPVRPFEAPPASPDPRTLGAPDLPLALELALAAPASGRESLVVFEGDAAEALPPTAVRALVAASAAAGTPLDLVLAAPRDERGPQAGARFVAVEPQGRVRAGGPFAIEVEVAGVDGAWRVDVVPLATPERATGEGAPLEAVEGGGGPEARGSASGSGSDRTRIELTAGDEGRRWYRLTLTSEAGTAAVAETQVAVEVGPNLQALLLATDEAAGTGVAAALEAQGIAVTRIAPRQLPSSLERLEGYDLVALANVAAKDVFPEHQALLERYVREAGGGLLLFGGERAFGPGGYYSTPLEEVSPLSARISDESPEVAMAFVLDRSGSMNGPVDGSTRLELTKLAVMEALALLGEKSLAALIAFDTEAEVLLPLTSTSDVDAFRTALSALGAAGGTSIQPGMEAALQLMAGSDSATRHVVVMTDGMSQEGDFGAAIEALGRLGVSTSFVGVGEADRRQLTNLAALSGGALHFARDFRLLPGLLAQEALMLAAEPIVTGPNASQWTSVAEPAPFLEEVSSEAAPEVLGYVRTTAKDAAAVHLQVGAEREPLLASWRYGLGRVVAFTSEIDGAWADAWIDSPAYGRLWSQVARWVAERPVRESGSVTIAGGEGVLDVVVELPAKVGGAPAGLPVVEVATLGGEVVARRPLEARSPGRAGARFELEEETPGYLEVRVGAAADLGLGGGYATVVSWPSLTPSGASSDRLGLGLLAEATGGRTRALGDGELTPVARVRAWRRLPAFWLLLGLALFLAAVGLRHGGRPAGAGWVSRSTRTRRAPRDPLPTRVGPRRAG